MISREYEISSGANLVKLPPKFYRFLGAEGRPIFLNGMSHLFREKNDAKIGVGRMTNFFHRKFV
jgi:hypothetical protein